MSKKLLYKFQWSYSWGDIESVFAAEPEIIKAVIGSEADFGESLGKHSHIVGILSEDDFEVISEDQDFIAKFEEIVGSTGLNPLKHLGEDES
jgi:hypothetical protein